MIIKKFVVGPLQENCYVVGDKKTREAFVIDPGDEPDRIIDDLKDSGLQAQAVILTHAHFDHVGAAGDIKKATGAKILMHREDLESYSMAKEQAFFWGYDMDDLPQPDGFIDEGNEIKTGNLSFRVMHTPGHSKGGICIYGEGVVFTGDTIFQGSVGRTDFPGGSIIELKKSFQRLLALPEDTKVYSGHGPETTIGKEKRENFFVREL